jgi:tetratricopeptide (TPR) repeat protein
MIARSSGARIVDIETGKELVFYKGDGFLAQAVFAPDGRNVVTVSDQERVRLRPVDPLPAAEAMKHRDLTPTEMEVFEIGSLEERRAYRQSWRAKLLSRDLGVAASVLAAQPDHPGMRDHLLEVLRDLVETIAGGWMEEASSEYHARAAEAIGRIGDADPETLGMLAELEALARSYDEEVARRRVVGPFVDRLFQEHISSKDVVGALRTLDSLSSRERETAIRMARGRSIPPGELNARSWRIVREENRAPAEYSRALRIARAACKAEPGNTAYLNTLGVALYRSGRLKEALDTLLRADRLNREGWWPNGRKEDLVFLAMCYKRLGQPEEARRRLKEARDVVARNEKSPGDEFLGFLREAEKLIDGNTENPEPHPRQ